MRPRPSRSGLPLIVGTDTAAPVGVFYGGGEALNGELSDQHPGSEHDRTVAVHIK